ncbi:MAG: hypothetical protein RIQ74_547, partial [Pseudomonadota bacterium]
KQGRSITGFSFKFKQKKNQEENTLNHRDKDTIDIFFKMSDAQINMYGNQLSELSELSYLAVGNESYQILANRIKDMLKDPEKQKQFHPYLKNLGFYTR